MTNSAGSSKICRDCGIITPADKLARHECGTRRLCLSCARLRSAHRRASLSDEQRDRERAAIKAHNARYRLERTEEQKEKIRAYYRNRRASESPERREAALARRRERRRSRPDQIKELDLAKARDRAAAWRASVSTEKRAEIRAYMREYIRENPDRQKYQRPIIKRATPAWDSELTSFVYGEAIHLAGLRRRAFGFSWHVDHFVPLQGKIVCGLHVWSNLKVIPAIMNMKKKNKFDDSLSDGWWI